MFNLSEPDTYARILSDVLEFEIVTPDGELRTANEYQETDLFWALRGGGPGFGVCIPTLMPS